MRSNAWPTSVKPSTTVRMPRPAGRKYHHAPRPIAPETKAKCSDEPHEMRFGSPRPMNASVASARMQPATTRIVLATMSCPTCGAMFVRMMRVFVAPSDFARATYCRLRSESVCERTMRAVRGHDNRPITRITITRFCPKIAASAIISGSAGMTRKKSVIAMRKASMPPMK